ncbi:MAG: GDSL-type esterase/lipase family protein [Burkholderiaceae bacterium]
MAGVVIGVIAAAPSSAAEPAEAWAGTERWRADNARIGPPAAGVTRVVFFGDSITEAWPLPAPPAAQRREYVNRGIGGQTTPQMLLRFRADVLALQPRAVVLLAGTNDIAGNTGPTTVAEIAGHLRSMLQLARAEGVHVVLCSVLPALAYPWQPEVRPAATITALNAELQALAREQGARWVDYHAAMADARDGLPAALADDGVHPNAAGYARMAALLAPVLEAALRD